MPAPARRSAAETVKLHRNPAWPPNLENLGHLDQGGYGVALLARWRGVEIVIKQLRPENANEPERFRREIRTLISLSRIGHAHIIPVFAANADAKEPWFAMPRAVADLRDFVRVRAGKYPEQEAERKKLRRCFPTPPTFADALRIYYQILAGVEAAHLHGVIHRDLKPGNILLFPDVNELSAKVADFGLCSTEAADGGNHTRTGMGFGTPNYWAPEQSVDAKRCDARADIFSLGIILHELLTGEELEFISKGSRPSRVDKESLSTRLGQPGREIILRCLEDEPEARYQTVDDLRYRVWVQVDGLLANTKPLSMDERVRLARPFGLFCTARECKEAEAKKFLNILKREAEADPAFLRQQLPVLLPGDIKNLVRHCPAGFADLLERFRQSWEENRPPFDFADQLGLFYRRILSHAAEQDRLQEVGATHLANELLQLAFRSNRRNVGKCFNELLPAGSRVEPRQTPGTEELAKLAKHVRDLDGNAPAKEWLMGTAPTPPASSSPPAQPARQQSVRRNHTKI